MKGKLIPYIVVTLLITIFVAPVQSISLQKEHNTLGVNDVDLDVAITTDWVNGWQDHGLLTREFAIDQNVYAYFEVSSIDDLYGLKMTHEWYYDNGTGLQFKWSWSTTCSGHWTSWATWTWWDIGMDYGKGIGFIKVYLNDTYTGETNWYAIDNTKPNKPTIDGPPAGKPNKLYDYNFTATDPDGYNLSYFVDWGDTTNSGWTAFVASGTKITLNHSWNKKGNYTIKCKVRDIAHNESDEETLSISISRTKAVDFKFNMFDWLFNRFPNAFPVLRRLIL